MKTIGEIIELCSDFLTDRKIERPRRLAEDLLSHVLKVKKLELYLQYDKPLREEELNIARDLLKRCGRGEPFEYVVGEMEFFGCKIKVNPNVLIPRPETELLVEFISKRMEELLPKGKEILRSGIGRQVPCRSWTDSSLDLGLKDRDCAELPVQKRVLWDVCTGSGSIGIALKKNLPELTVVLSDISPEALALAEQNAKLNQVQVEILQGDLLEPFKGRKADFIVCNPPYISHDEFAGLDPSVRRFEPKLALIGGERGTEFYERLKREIPPFLNPDAKLFFEIGAGQGEAVKQIFGGAGVVHKDYAGHPRFFFLEKL